MNFCMVAYTFYEADNRVRRYGETLVALGHKVDAVTLRKPGQEKYAEIKGVSVHRVQEREINEKGKISYLSRLIKFFAVSSCWITKHHIRNRYAAIHVHSVPDFEVFATFIPKIMGAQVILDIHDLVPEFFADKFHVNWDSIPVRSLILVEKLSCRFADHVIVANDIWRKRLIERSVNQAKCTTIMNYPTEIFKRRKNRRIDRDKVVMVYPGTLAYHQGLDIAIEACLKIREVIPKIELHIYGKGPELVSLEALVKKSSLDSIVFIHKPVPMETIAEVLANADIGIVPKRADGFGNEAFSTKIYEYMAVGLPVVASRTMIDELCFSDEIVKFFNPGSATDLAEKVIEMTQSPQKVESQIQAADRHMLDNRWDVRQKVYNELMGRIIEEKK